MEIIENGRPYSEREYIEVCKACGCKFKYKEKEVTKESDAVVKKYKNKHICYVNCPQCQSQLYVDNRGKSIEELELERKVNAAIFQFKIEISVAVILFVLCILFKFLLIFVFDILLFISSIVSLIYWLVLRNSLLDYKLKSNVTMK